MSGRSGVGMADLPAIGPAVVTHGVFDGVHLGHRAILEATRDLAAEQGMASVALVFDPPPEEVLRPGTRSLAWRHSHVNLGRIEAAGVTGPSRSASMSGPRRSAPRRSSMPSRRRSARGAGDVVAQRLRTRSWRGRPRACRSSAAERGFDACGWWSRSRSAARTVSSTRIRAAIADGHVEEAQALGVVPYLEGIVVAGDRRGRELGFPTANLRSTTGRRCRRLASTPVA